jgi:hypothetical protein
MLALVSRLVHLAKQSAFEREAYQGKGSSQTQVIVHGIQVSTGPHDADHTKTNQRHDHGLKDDAKRSTSNWA